MNPDLRASVARQQARLASDLAAFLDEYFDYDIAGGAVATEIVLPETLASGLIEKAAQSIAGRMVSGVALQNAKTWRAAARRSLHGKRIYQALRTEMGSPIGMRVDELIAQNAKLIEKLPDTLLKQAQAFVAREQRRGSRSSQIEKELRQRLPQATRSQVKLFARTEVGRAETALTRARAERLGLNWYEWATSHDKRVRPAHKLMASVLVAWTDAASPEALAGERAHFGRYHPGTVPNCRCLALPLIDLDEVAWPHQVYAHGVVDRVGRAQFERWISVPGAA